MGSEQLCSQLEVEEDYDASIKALGFLCHLL